MKQNLLFGEAIVANDAHPSHRYAEIGVAVKTQWAAVWGYPRDM